MTARDPNLSIKAFLDEGLDELPERSYDAVRAAIDQTRQWAVVGPWKEPQIMTATRFALIAAAIAVVAVVAIKFIPLGGGFGLQPTPTPSPSPTTAPSVSSLPITSGGPQPLLPGTYAVGNPFSVPLTITVPVNWQGNIGGPYAAYLQKPYSPANVSFTIDQSLYADVCHFNAGRRSPVPGTASDLASAFAAMAGLTATQPKDVTVGGYTGKEVTLTAPATTAGCDLPPDDKTGFRLWQLPLGGTEDLSAGMVEHLTILDVAGQRLVIQTSETPDESAADKSEAASIISSVVLPPAN